MGEKKSYPLLKSELINYQQKLACEVRDRAKMHKCTSLYQQSAFINLSTPVEGQITLVTSKKKGTFYYRMPGLAFALHRLHFPSPEQ